MCKIPTVTVIHKVVTNGDPPTIRWQTALLVVHSQLIEGTFWHVA